MARFRESNAPVHFRSDLPSASAPSSGKARMPPTPATTAFNRTPAAASSSGHINRTPASTGSSKTAGQPTPARGGKQFFGGKTTASSAAGGSRGLGLGGKGLKRHRKILRDNILGITKGSIRRLARRGGVKRISATIYQETRTVLRKRLETLLKDICAVVEVSGRKTVCTSDVVFVLNRHGTPIYGFGQAQRGGIAG
ncbi:Histone H4 [Cercospora beticola]|uniref:Histone H4 n=2 Tax=Cercospora beticola TaxID=122368 RepID=A0A2G5H7I1_CERBT|nr:Histone H4 [Cercospora beticola]PIA88478.1 Histone H4 [Cercospora beticola]CAK1358654.1 unnamed protein product [Cercospora beticola]